MRTKTLSVVPEGRHGCYLWRNVWPSAAIERHGYVADVVWFDEWREEVEPRLMSGDYNVVMTPRCAWKERWMQARWDHLLDKAHLAWVYELDDDLFSPDIIQRFYEYNIARGHGKDIEPEEREIRIKFLAKFEREMRSQIVELVDVVIVSSDRLAKVTAEHTGAPIHVIPNAIDVDWFNSYAKLDQPREVEGLTIGWAGGWRPEDDTRILEKVWPRLAKKYPHVKFILAGWHPPGLVKAMPEDQLICWQWKELEDYPFVLRNVDISCCVVANHDWNACKTPIKWIESAVAGSAVVASHALYDEVIDSGMTGLLATTEEEWETRLEELILSEGYRDHLNKNALNKVMEKHTTESVWQLWVNAWEDALERSQRVKEGIAV